jgi:hypothetical protein
MGVDELSRFLGVANSCKDHTCLNSDEACRGLQCGQSTNCWVSNPTGTHNILILKWLLSLEHSLSTLPFFGSDRAKHMDYPMEQI